MFIPGQSFIADDFPAFAGRRKTGGFQVGIHHDFHEILEGNLRRIASIPFGVEVAEIELLFVAGEDARQAVGNLARDERFPAAGRFVDEEDPVASEQAIALALVLDHPIGVDLNEGTAYWLEGENPDKGDQYDSG